MTNNQNTRIANQEKERSNRASEAQKRSELKETARSNREKERAKRLDQFNDAVNTVSKVIGTINDPSWYNKDAKLIENAGSISYFRTLGTSTPIQCTVSSTQDSSEDTHSKVIDGFDAPGFSLIHFVPSIPDTVTMNTIMDKLYAYVRHANSGHSNYEPNDLLMYLLSVNEAYSLISHLQRLYSLLLTYKSENFYYGKQLITAMGYDYDSFIENLSNFRLLINVSAKKVNALNINRDFPIFLRRMWLNTNIFKDYPVKRSSEYIFMQDYFLQYEEDTVPTDVGSMLTPVAFYNQGNAKMTYNTLVGLLNTFIDKLIKSEDIGIISGDILKAYGEGGLFKLNMIPEDFHIESIYSSEVLSQINGATMVGIPYPESIKIYTNIYGQIKQGDTDEANSNSLVVNHKPLFMKGQLHFKVVENKYSPSLINDECIVNMYKDDVSPMDTIVATRLSATTQSKFNRYITDNTQYIPSVECTSHGTEICTFMDLCIYASDYDEDGVATGSKFVLLTKIFDGVPFRNTDYLNPTKPSFVTYERIVHALASMDWAPRIRVLSIAAGSDNAVADLGDVGIIYDNKDLCNFAVINHKILDNLHNVAELSLFNIS